MLPGLPLQKLAEKIERNRLLKKDFIASTDMLSVNVTGEGAMLEIPDHGAFPIRPLAHDQIGTHAGIPAKYYDRMLAEAPDLLATNVNTWFRKNPSKRMVRTLDKHARSFNSNSYRRIENEQIAEAVIPVLRELPGIQIVSSDVTERKLYIHFIVPTIEGEVKKGDVVQVGGIISNSEVGCGSVSVAGLAWRLICLNGMKTGDAFRRAHAGKQIDDNEELWASDTRHADDAALMLKVRDMVKAVVDETRFRATINKMKELAGVKVTGNVVQAVEVLSSVVSITEVERSGVLRSLIEGNDLSAWGVANAVTAQAHAATSYDRAVDLEAFGGQLLDLPATDWKRILEAA